MLPSLRLNPNVRGLAGLYAGTFLSGRQTIAESDSGLAPLLAGFLANALNPGIPFLVYAPVLIFAATLLAGGRQRKVAKTTEKVFSQTVFARGKKVAFLLQIRRAFDKRM